ncbi:GTP-binding protein [Acidovorax sp.]|uniref:CobW family GTP-binding protein n=1 Tax=Acidovorax sp. TaxID=1872122 RepID=UPI002637EF26|nr:GTP-binding protein [Acidovorax sp.]
MPLPIARIRVILLTGFLGSGKTTLLRSLLQLPQLRDTAVLINELGAVGLDHHLVWGAVDTTLILENGCVCCSAQGDLAGTLEDLFWKRLHRKIPRFERVVIETTGIADPGRIVDMFSGQSLIAERYVLSSLLCTVDGLVGEQQLQQHPECLAQAAAADAILITKTDIAKEEGLARLELQLKRVNCAAVCQRSDAGPTAMEALLGTFDNTHLDRGRGLTRKLVYPSGLMNGEQAGEQTPGPLTPAGVHTQITSLVLRLEKFRNHDELQEMLRSLLSWCGARILRVKGLVEVSGDALLTVVQAVGDHLFPFERLPVGVQLEGAGFLVLITIGLSKEELLHCRLPTLNQLMESVRNSSV